MEVTLQDLDDRLVRYESSTISEEIMDEYGKLLVSEEEFNKVMDRGVRDRFIKKIREFYESLGHIEIKITNEDLYAMHVERYR